jgi:hypothetical protein
MMGVMHFFGYGSDPQSKVDPEEGLKIKTIEQLLHAIDVPREELLSQSVTLPYIVFLIESGATIH